MNLKRKIEKENEKKEIENIRKVYGKKPKDKCPKCHKKSLFMTNEKKETFCIRCDKIVKIGK